MHTAQSSGFTVKIFSLSLNTVSLKTIMQYSGYLIWASREEPCSAALLSSVGSGTFVGLYDDGLNKPCVLVTINSLVLRLLESSQISFFLSTPFTSCSCLHCNLEQLFPTIVFITIIHNLSLSLHILTQVWGSCGPAYH